MYSALSGPTDWILRCIKTYLYLFYLSVQQFVSREITISRSHVGRVNALQILSAVYGSHLSRQHRPCNPPLLMVFCGSCGARGIEVGFSSTVVIYGAVLISRHCLSSFLARQVAYFRDSCCYCTAFLLGHFVVQHKSMHYNIA